MEVLIRPVPHASYARVDTDAVSCTYDIDGFTLMNAVLIAHRLDREHFRMRAHMHDGDQFRVIAHSDKKPLVITSTKTEHWDSEPSATKQIISTANAELCESLCMTHFGFILGNFPTNAFRQCLESIQNSGEQTHLRHVIVDVDDRYYDEALRVSQTVKPFDFFVNGESRVPGLYDLILGLGTPAKQVVQKCTRNAMPSNYRGHLRIEAIDSFYIGLDGWDFDRPYLQSVIDGASDVLLVTCAGGRSGSEMTRFAAEYSRSKGLSVNVVLSNPPSWEGRRRRSIALSLTENLRAIGVQPIVVDGDLFDNENWSWQEVFTQLDTTMLDEVVHWTKSRA